MQYIVRNYLIIAILLVVSVFIPQTQAQIFEGIDEVGICLGEPDLEKYPECADVDCEDEEYLDSVLCMTEAQAGTLLAEGSLESTGITHTDNFGDFIKKIVNFSLPYLTLAAFVGYVVAGFLYVTALGNDDQIGKAKKILIWSTVGLILVILSYAITQLFTTELVGGLQDEGNQDPPDLNQFTNP